MGSNLCFGACPVSVVFVYKQLLYAFIHSLKLSLLCITDFRVFWVQNFLLASPYLALICTSGWLGLSTTCCRAAGTPRRSTAGNTSQLRERRGLPKEGSPRPPRDRADQRKPSLSWNQQKISRLRRYSEHASQRRRNLNFSRIFYIS